MHSCYSIAGIFGGIKINFGKLLFLWLVDLIWQIGRHVSLGMRTVNEMANLILVNS